MRTAGLEIVFGRRRRSETPRAQLRRVSDWNRKLGQRTGLVGGAGHLSLLLRSGSQPWTLKPSLDTRRLRWAHSMVEGSAKDNRNGTAAILGFLFLLLGAIASGAPSPLPPDSPSTRVAWLPRPVGS